MRFDLKRGRSEEIAQRDAAVSAEEDLRHRLPRQVAHGPHLPALVEQERVDAAEIEVHHFVAWGAGVGEERAVRLRTTLVAEKDLGALVAREERRRRAQLGGEPGEDGAIAYRKQPGARPGELEDHRPAMLRFDTPDDLAQAATNELKRDISRAHEGASAAAQEHLHRARRAQPDGPLRERLAELARRDDDGHHPGPHAGEPRLVGL